MLKAFKYRVYPNELQKTLLTKTFGACRFVYNQTLTHRQNKYEHEKIFLTKFECISWCNHILKNENEWLKEVDSKALANAIYDMDAAYRNFLAKKTGFPNYKTKRNKRQSYTTNCINNNISVDFDGEKIKLPKLGSVKARIHRNFDGTIKKATVSESTTGKFFVSVLVEAEQKILPSVTNKIGIYIEPPEKCIDSNGKNFVLPKSLTKYEKKLTSLFKQLKRKRKNSANLKKLKKRIEIYRERVKNIRLDFFHKISSETIHENQVVISGKMSYIPKSHFDSTWYEFEKFLSYKAEWYGRTHLNVGDCSSTFGKTAACNALVKGLRLLAR